MSCQGRRLAGDGSRYIFSLRTGRKNGGSFIELTDALSADPVPARFQRRRHSRTNTMVKEHQMVAEDFMPRADIVLFVF